MIENLKVAMKMFGVLQKDGQDLVLSTKVDYFLEDLNLGLQQYGDL